MKRSTVIVFIFLVIGGVGGWLTWRNLSGGPPSAPEAAFSTPVERVKGVVPSDADRAFHTLLTAPAGQITGGSVRSLKSRLADRSHESAATLERGLSSTSPVERLLAFRLLLETEGWSPRLREYALRDPFVLIRVEASDWLYLSSRFREREEFFTALSANGENAYQALVPSLQHRRWSGLPASVEMLDIGRGIDRFLIDLFRASENAANAAAADLTSATLPFYQQAPLLELLHASNRADHPLLLRALLNHAAEDNPARYTAIWLLGQDFATSENRQLLSAHLGFYPNDPLRPRVQQAMASIDQELALVQTRFALFEPRLAGSLAAENLDAWGPPFLALLNEALRQQRTPEKAILEKAKQVLVTAPAKDYRARQRLADIEFLLSKS